MEQNYSHSKLEVIRKCFLQFKYKYIDKIQEEKDTSATDFGNVCHLIAENYTGTGKEELISLYKKYKKDFTITEFYENKVKLALKNIHSYYIKELKNPEIESIQKEISLETNLTPEIKINGKIDILIKYKNGKYKIVDYKTSKKKNADHTNQLSMYQLLLHKVYNIDYKHFTNGILYLALEGSDKYGNIILNEKYENILLPYEIDESDVVCLTNEIQQIHETVKKCIDKNEWSCNPTWFNCTYCGFNNNCDKKFIK